MVPAPMPPHSMGPVPVWSEEADACFLKAAAYPCEISGWVGAQDQTDKNDPDPELM